MINLCIHFLLENGGHVVKISLYCVIAAYVVQQDVRESKLDENAGNCWYNDEIIRMKGDAYLIDCDIASSDKWTSNNPKFSLLAFV